MDAEESAKLVDMLMGKKVKKQVTGKRKKYFVEKDSKGGEKTENLKENRDENTNVEYPPTIIEYDHLSTNRYSEEDELESYLKQNKPEKTEKGNPDKKPKKAFQF